MVDIRTGKPVPVKNGVGPRGEGLETDRSSGDALQLDREADPQTGEELPGCIGPQCESFQVPPPAARSRGLMRAARLAESRTAAASRQWRPVGRASLAARPQVVVVWVSPGFGAQRGWLVSGGCRARPAGPGSAGSPSVGQRTGPVPGCSESALTRRAGAPPQFGVSDPFKGGLDTQSPADGPATQPGPGRPGGPDVWDHYQAPPAGDYAFGTAIPPDRGERYLDPGENRVQAR